MVGRRRNVAKSVGRIRIATSGRSLISVFSASKGTRVRKKFWVALLLLILGSSPAAANVIYVDCIGPNDPGSGRVQDPFRRIQPGLDAAINGDTVEILPGIYTSPGNYDLDPGGKSITIQSIDPNDPCFAANTIIDPNKAGRGFYIQNDEDANCIISGLTIRNARIPAGYNGAGIYCYDTSPTIRNCIIRDGYAEDGSGGGICFDYGSATVINCTITGNTAGNYGYGGGISCRFSSPTIIGCTISGNTAALTGGGIDSGSSEPNILNCIIIDNNAAAGGGINCYYPGAANVINCTIVANSAEYAGGAVYCWSGGSAIIKNSILWANSAIDGTQLGLDEQGTASIAYCDVQSGQTEVYDPCGLLVWGGGNINSDPCFASFDPNGDPNLWDFHLKSIYGRWDAAVFSAVDLTKNGFVDLQDFAVFGAQWLEEGIGLTADLDNNGKVDLLDLEIMLEAYPTAQPPQGMWVLDDTSSPCIDAGDPNSDWIAEPWPNSKRINMGAFGGTNQASKNGLKADFDVDGYVDFKDFSYLATNWGTQQSCIEDLDKNGQVDVYDLGEFCVLWLEQN